MSRINSEEFQEPNNLLKVSRDPDLQDYLIHENLLKNLYREDKGFSVVCSTLEYALAAVRAKKFERSFVLFRNRVAAGAFLTVSTFRGKIGLVPAEIEWEFSTNLLAKAPSAAIDLINEVNNLVGKEIDLIRLSGVTRELEKALLKEQKITHPFQVIKQKEVISVVVNIENGAESAIKQASANKRKNLKKALRSQKELRFDYINSTENPELVWQRLLAIERQSWKWKTQSSIFQSSYYQVFYQELFERFNAKSQAHILFVKYKEKDIAYIFGTSYSEEFRGFQTSFIEEPELRKLSPGNNGHLFLMDILSNQGIKTYNFGSAMDYKMGWSKQRIVTSCLDLIY